MIQGKSKKELTRSIGFSTHCSNPNQLPSLQLDLHRFPLRFPFGEKDGDNQAPFEATEYLDFRPYCGHLSLLLLQRSSVNLEVTRVTYQVHLTYHSSVLLNSGLFVLLLSQTQRGSWLTHHDCQFYPFFASTMLTSNNLPGIWDLEQRAVIRVQCTLRNTSAVIISSNL